MIELNRNQPPAHLHTDLEDLQSRAAHHRDRHKQSFQPLADLHRTLAAALRSPGSWFSKLPTRFLLHTVVVLTVPLALLLSQIPLRPATSADSSALTTQDTLIGMAPISLDTSGTLTQIGDPPLDETEALPVPLSLSSRSELLAPMVVPATITGDVVRMRNGPGLAYDDVNRINGGSSVEVVGRYEEWLQVRQANDPAIYWVAAELVDIPEAVIYALNVVPSEQIPPPPPPKIGVVVEEGLNLRDGPGTNYVSMARMSAGQELTLVQQYQEWFLVEYGTQYGWVTRDFLNIVDGVVERVPVAQTVPDPNPPLVGMVLENSVNMRKGPGSAYDRVATINAGAQVSLLGKYKDWYKVQLSDGTKAWIFSDLMKISPMASRRVPVTTNFPALPTRATTTRGSGSSGGPVNVAASGDVASYAVQFIGSRYVWGGSSPRGFDCSGLTSYVYRQFGVGLPHSAAAQFSTRYGAMIGNMGSLAPGDLMFFASTGGRRGISHVAIYIGGGQMLHAMTPSYGVQVSGIWNSYWQSHFVGAIRPYR
ncbi:SH3 domain-containing protein [Candidatus Oscillochloris fontis]|uniref:C40 family peptidase n=1 Tax=Candidatus Oscillochloris fontis TaxID=2496868 RepID=UPI00101BF8FF|nr:SH3 domain-containing protein [Candidatus Oscillochloris fontis]